MRRTTTMLLVTAILGLAAMPLAYAEDEVMGDSVAEQAFRDAWWAETSSGALDRALDGYRKAVAAEGPAAVRAKALYRMGVVLERIGKTDDAIRALEQLAKDFPGEADLQAKARDRLEEWTAVDLRTNFQEWYERYKYSPEFQGRIVELVLALGASSGEVGASNRAAEELLTIGQASVPALEAHLGSSNQRLRGRAVDLLLQLGTYPPARHLLETDDWSKMPRGWNALLAAPQEARTRLLSELDALDSDVKLAEPVRAVLQGRDGWARAVRADPNAHLIRATLAAEPAEAVVQELCAMVPELAGPDAHTLAYYLLGEGLVPNATALAWLALPKVREWVTQRIVDGALHDPNAWRFLVQTMDALPADHAEQRALLQALMPALADAAPDTDLGPAVLAYERAAPYANVGRAFTGQGSGSSTSTSAALADEKAASRFLEKVVEEARDPRVARNAVETWAQMHRGDEDVSRRLIAWAQSQTSPQVSEPAAKLAGSMATDETLDDLLNALGPQGPMIDAQFIEGLRHNRLFHSLTWGDERYLRLNAYAQAASGPGMDRKLVQELDRLFRELHELPERIDQATRLALKLPRRVWIGTTKVLHESTLPFFNNPEYLATVRAGFRTQWVHWPLEDRIAALQWFKGLPAPVFDDAELMEFLRGELGTQWAAKGDEASETLEREGKENILKLLPDVGLAEVRAVFDLSTAEGAYAAWNTQLLPLTAEVYEALAAIREADASSERWNFLNHWLRKAPGELKYRVAAEMTSDSEVHARRTGLEWLALRRSADDVRVFEKALADPDAGVRLEAAKALEGVYDQAAIQALAKALDDLNPAVRDQVLKTLETIKDIEEKKDYWRDFAEGKR